MSLGGSEAARLFVGVDADTSKADRKLGQMGQTAQKTGGILQTALGFAAGQVAFVALGKGVDAVKESLVGYNARMEQAQIGFTTLLGSADKAKTFISDLQTFAAKTPFDFPGLQTASNQMLAMGFSSEEILPTLTAVGDAVAALGLGSDSVQRVTMALGQMKAAGRVNAQDMNQLTSVGIPAWKLLADAMGKTVPEVRKLSEQGLIPANDAIRMITEGIEKGNMGGMMEAQSKTFIGAMSTIKDSMSALMGTSLKPLFSLISQGAIAFANFVSSAAGMKIANSVAAGITAIVTKAKGLVKLLQKFRGITASDFIGKDFAMPLMRARMAIFLLLRALRPFISDLKSGFQQIGSTLRGFMDPLRDLASSIGPRVVNFFADTVTQIGLFLTLLRSSSEAGQALRDKLALIATILAVVGGAFAALWIYGQVLSGIEGMVNGVTSAAKGMKTAFDNAISPIKKTYRAVKSVVDMSKKLVDKTISVAASGVDKALEGLRSIRDALGTIVSKTVTVVVNQVKGPANAVGSWLEKAIAGAAGAVAGALMAMFIAAVGTIGSAAVIAAAVAGLVLLIAGLILAFPEQAGYIAGAILGMLVQAFVIAIGGLVTAITTLFGPVLEGIIGWLETLGVDLGVIWDAIMRGDWGAAIEGALKFLLDLFLGLPVAILSGLVEGIGDTLDWLGTLGKQFLDMIGPGIDGILKWFGEWWTKFSGGFTKGFGEWIGMAGKAAGDVLKAILDALAGAPKALADLAITIGKGFANGLVGLLEGAVNAIIGAVNSIQIHIGGFEVGPVKFDGFNWNGMGLPRVKLPRFERGGMVPGSRSVGVPILAHGKEMILPSWATNVLQDLSHDARRSIRGEAIGGRGQGGGPVAVILNIGTFYGTEENVRKLSASLGAEIRYQTIRRTGVSAGTS